MKSEEFDRAFDDGEDVTSQLDMSAARRPGLEQRRVNVDFPEWMIESLDREARRLDRIVHPILYGAGVSQPERSSVG